MSPEEYENEIAVLHLRERVRNAEVARLTSELAAAREALKVAGDEFAATIKGIGEMRVDAQRYLWLRNHCTPKQAAGFVAHGRGINMDAAIDAARSAGGEG